MRSTPPTTHPAVTSAQIHSRAVSPANADAATAATLAIMPARYRVVVRRYPGASMRCTLYHCHVKTAKRIA